MAILIDSYSESNQNNNASFGNSHAAQSFAVTSACKLNSVKIYLTKGAGVTGDAYVSIYAHTGTYGTSSKGTGSPLATSDSVSIATFQVSPTWGLIEFTFSGANKINLDADTKYVVAIKTDNISGGVAYAGLDTTSPTHGGNYTERNSLGNWAAYSSLDLCFYVYGTDDKNVTPNTGALTITGYEPTVVANHNATVTPNFSTLTVTGFEPTVISGNVVAWYNSSWLKRKSHLITGSSGAGTNYQIRIIVYKGSGSDSGGSVYCGGNCKDDFGDIRFTTADGTTPLDYWLETGSLVSGTSAAFWVEVAANLDSNQSIYIYYSNSGASSASNGANTFLLFDDFDGGSLDTNKWTQRNGNAATFSGGIMTVVSNNVDPAKMVATGASTSDNQAIVARCRRTSGSNTDERFGVGVRTENDSTPQGYNFTFRNFSTYGDNLFLNDAIAWGGTNYGSWSATTWYIMECFHNGTNVYGRRDYGTLRSEAGWNARAAGYPSLNIGSFGGTTEWDWAFVRKAIVTEPAHSTYGVEEAKPVNNINILADLGGISISAFSPAASISENKNVFCGVGTLSVNSFAPVVFASDSKNISTGFGSLSFTSFAPLASVSDNKNIISGYGTATITSFAPVVFASDIKNISPGLGLLSVAGFAPTVIATDHKNIIAGYGVVSLSTFAPAVLVSDNKYTLTEPGVVNLGGFEPRVFASDKKEATPGLGVVSLAGLTPIISISDKKNIVTGVGVLSFTAFAPVVFASIKNEATPEYGIINLIGLAPLVFAGNKQELHAGIGLLATTGFAPTVFATDIKDISVSAGELSVIGFSPSVVATDYNNIIAGYGIVGLSAFAPSVIVSDNKNIIAGSGTAAITSFEPAVFASNKKEVLPGLGSVILTNYLPVIFASNRIYILPDFGVLDVTGFVPTVFASESKSILPGSGLILITGFTPLILASDKKICIPGTGVTLFAGFEPAIAITQNLTVFTGCGELAITNYSCVTEIKQNISISPGFNAIIIDGFEPNVFACFFAFRVIRNVIITRSVKRNVTVERETGSEVELTRIISRQVQIKREIKNPVEITRKITKQINLKP